MIEVWRKASIMKGDSRVEVKEDRVDRVAV